MDSQADDGVFGLGSAVVRQLLAMGVAEAVIAAGARNLEVTVAASRAEHFRCWNHFEERCAGFFALGRARASGRPVAVVTTSGTAAAELLPAVIEAHYQGISLVAVTADRPAAFRGTGAPQAIEQQALFGRYANWFDVEDIEGLERIPKTLPRGPVQWNICFSEPQAMVLEKIPVIRDEPRRSVSPLRLFEAPERVEEFFAGTPRERCLIIVGPVPPDQGAAVTALVADYDCLVIAEAISNLGLHQTLLTNLRRDTELQLDGIEKVLRIGGTPTCRLWRDLEEWPAIKVAHLTDLPFTGLARGGGILGDLPPAATAGNLGKRVSAEHGAVRSQEELPDREVEMITALAGMIPAGAAVFIGNSLPVREWNQIFPLGKHRCFANRGANGIDGNLSSFLGLVACDEDEAWAVVGDLTALYDLAACFILPQIAFRGRLRIVVINNGGGKIFSRLPALDLTKDDRVAAMIENPHTADFEGFARLWGLAYRRIEAVAELADPGDKGVELWDVVVPQTTTQGKDSRRNGE